RCDSLNDCTEASSSISLGTTPTPLESFLQTSDSLINQTLQDLKTKFSLLLADNDNYTNNTIVLKINKQEYNIHLPDSYISDKIIPSILMNCEIISENIYSKRDKYFLYLGNNRLNILCHRVIIDDQYLLYIPIDINDNKDLNIKLLKYSSKNYNIMGHKYSFIWPHILKNKVKINLEPEFINSKLLHPLQVYLRAIEIYLGDNKKSQREVCAITKKEFKLEKFDHSLLSRFLSNKFIKNNNLDNKEVNDQIKSIINFKGPRNCSFWEQKKLICKFKYSSIEHLYSFYDRNNFKNHKIDITMENILPILNSNRGKIFFQLALSCTIASGYFP
ncbi:MAG: hypothetical protein LBD41_04610, partial [Clostridiales Family XIII bacterium]|nr:hypothetical protein [Clostridiales Family XIII bacterium]